MDDVTRRQLLKYLRITPLERIPCNDEYYLTKFHNSMDNAFIDCYNESIRQLSTKGD